MVICAVTDGGLSEGGGAHGASESRALLAESVETGER